MENSKTRITSSAKCYDPYGSISTASHPHVLRYPVAYYISILKPSSLTVGKRTDTCSRITLKPPPSSKCTPVYLVSLISHQLNPSVPRQPDRRCRSTYSFAPLHVYPSPTLIKTLKRKEENMMMFDKFVQFINRIFAREPPATPAPLFVDNEYHNNVSSSFNKIMD